MTGQKGSRFQPMRSHEFLIDELVLLAEISLLLTFTIRANNYTAKTSFSATF